MLMAQGHTPIVFKGMTAKQWLLSAWIKRIDLDVVHFHDIRWKSRMLIGFMGFLGLRVVLTIHGDSLKEQLESGGWSRRRLLAFAMKNLPHIVGVKATIRELLVSMGVRDSTISVINAYIPYVGGSKDTPDDISSFIRSHHPRLMANGFGVVPLSDTTDLYGIELTIDLCTRLVKNYPEIGFIFFLAQTGDQERCQRFETIIREKGLQEHYIIIMEQELAPALSSATVFLRPTFQDGFAISVAEAIDLGVPTIASDICAREAGAIIFRSGDLNDLYLKVTEVLDHYETAKQFVEKFKPTSSFGKLLSVYKEVAAQ